MIRYKITDEDGDSLVLTNNVQRGEAVATIEVTSTTDIVILSREAALGLRAVLDKIIEQSEPEPFKVGDRVKVVKDGEPGDWPGHAGLPLRLFLGSRLPLTATVTDAETRFSTPGDPILEVRAASGATYRVRPVQIEKTLPLDEYRPGDEFPNVAYVRAFLGREVAP